MPPHQIPAVSWRNIILQLRDSLVEYFATPSGSSVLTLKVPYLRCSVCDRRVVMRGHLLLLPYMLAGD